MTDSRSYLPFKAEVRPPRQRLPAGTCDCHFHVFEDPQAYPFATPRSYTPTLATLDDFRRMNQAVGIDRAVLVHPSVYGRHHQTFEDTLAKSGDWMRGVAVVFPDTSDEQIQRWHQLGARGTRCNAVSAGGAALADLPGIVARIRHLGWHLQLFINVSADPTAVARLADLGLPVVVDHFGHVPADQAASDRGFANLLSLVREGRVWVKLSGAYRVSAQRGRFEEVRPMAEALVKANSRQLVWGTDWPHPDIPGPMPDDGDLADVLFDWMGDTERQQVLVDNPTRLYWG